MAVNPATYIARATCTAAHSWMRRAPISIQERSSAVAVIREASEEIALPWLRIDSIRVSRIISSVNVDNL